MEVLRDFNGKTEVIRECDIPNTPSKIYRGIVTYRDFSGTEANKT